MQSQICYLLLWHRKPNICDQERKMCGQTGARTRDPSLTGQELYRLSYPDRLHKFLSLTRLHNRDGKSDFLSQCKSTVLKCRLPMKVTVYLLCTLSRSTCIYIYCLFPDLSNWLLSDTVQAEEYCDRDGFWRPNSLALSEEDPVVVRDDLLWPGH